MERRGEEEQIRIERWVAREEKRDLDREMGEERKTRIERWRGERRNRLG